MKIIKKVGTFLRYDTATRLLLIEAYYYLGRARLLKTIPFSKLALSLGQHMKETSMVSDKKDIEVLNKITKAIYSMSKYTFWESECLVKAIAGMKMLEKRKIESTLYLGTAKDEKGDLIAHAWLRSGPYFITGFKGMERYTVVAKFANENSMIKVE